MPRKVYGGRALLNLPGHHSTAAIVAEIEDTTSRPLGEDGYGLYPRVICEVTDCNSRVAIEMDIGTANQLENSLHKIDTIVAVLAEMREGLILEHHRLQDRLDAWPEDKRDVLYTLRNAVGKRSSEAL